MTDPFANLPRGHYGAILADPPWHFQAWSAVPLWNGEYRKDGSKILSATRSVDYDTLSIEQIAQLPVRELAADDCVLFIWGIWILMPKLFDVIDAWGFTYKTCAFDWMKARASQIDMFREDSDVQMGMGYWTRANTEPCLLATRGKPKRLSAAVRQGIIEPRREHSRKPDCVHDRIQKLVGGPYLELFARAPRTGWDVWGNQTDKFAEAAE